MSYIQEYVAKGLDAAGLRRELVARIERYNALRDTYLLVYAAAMNKPRPGIGMEQQDYYMLHDMLSGHGGLKRLDVYVETPGGSGEAAEDIVKLLRSKARHVSFVVSGEAKSAGTIVVLSGNDILMTDTGSLGPIDAQVRVGRSVVSAHDYMKWVSEKRDEAAKNGALNPFDATMVAQISPGELLGVGNKLSFAESLVASWLEQYKFASWTKTQHRGLLVTPDMKREAAAKVAKELTDHSKWKTHGKSIKLEDLRNIGLQVKRVDDQPDLAEVVYRIQAVLMLLFDQCRSVKMFATLNAQVERTEMPNAFAQSRILPLPGNIPWDKVSGVEAEVVCGKCKTVHRLYARLKADSKYDEAMREEGAKPLPKDGVLVCDCGNKVDLTPIVKDIESKAGRRILPA